MKLKMFVCAMLPLTLAFGCGDDEGASEGGKETPGARGAAADGKIGNSDPSTVIETLNSAEWKAACMDIATAGNNRELAHGACILGGILGTVLGISCESTYDLCIESEPDVDCDAKPAECTATLAEADACNLALLAYLAAETEGLDCSSPISALNGIDQSYYPPECTLVQEKCPDFEPSAAPQMDTGFEDF